MVNLAPISAILRAYQSLRASLVSQLIAKDEMGTPTVITTELTAAIPATAVEIAAAINE
jgi:hypothetical protein